MTSSPPSVYSDPRRITDRPGTRARLLRYGRQFLVWLSLSLVLMGCGALYGWGMAYLADAIAQTQTQSLEPHLAQVVE